MAIAYSAQDSPTFNALADQWNAWGNRNIGRACGVDGEGRYGRGTMLRVTDQVECVDGPALNADPLMSASSRRVLRGTGEP